MFIAAAYAATEAAATAATAAPVAPDSGNFLMSQIGMILFMVVMFYFLLIMPQQRRFKEHKAMLDSLKKGDKVVTAGGLLGTVEKIVGDTEVVVDLGEGVKVTALRSTIQTRMEAPTKTEKSKKESGAAAKDSKK